MIVYDLKTSGIDQIMGTPDAYYPVSPEGIDRAITEWFFLTDKPTFQFFLTTDKFSAERYNYGDFLTVERLPEPMKWERSSIFGRLCVVNAKGKNYMGYIYPTDHPERLKISSGNKGDKPVILKCNDIRKSAYVFARYTYEPPLLPPLKTPKTYSL
jgi:hypothetical protein